MNLSLKFLNPKNKGYDVILKQDPRYKLKITAGFQRLVNFKMLLKMRTPSLLIAFLTFCCLALMIFNICELHWMQSDHLQYHHEYKTDMEKPTHNYKNAPSFMAFGRDVDSGYLKHVFDTFSYFGYVRQEITSENVWDVLWAHDYPFKKLQNALKNLKHHQIVNHFPGFGFITNKMDLALTKIQHIPKAFKMPQQKQQLLEYGKKHPHKLFVQKNNNHRGINIETLSTLDFTSNDSFVQEYIDRPLLVDGYKFDIGVYTAVTSIDPLRVYIYDGDILFRYCPEKYHPFDAKNVNKYVIGDDYLPTWKVPSLKKLYLELGYSMKHSFNTYLQKLGKNPSKIWLQIEEAIRSVCLLKEQAILNVLNSYPSKHNFFEMVRFDFVVDEDLNVYIMEANMSPNLSSAHYPQNRLLYEQLLFSLFSLVGLASKINVTSAQVDIKQVVVEAGTCASTVCTSCIAPQCQLCFPCLTSETLDILKLSYREHINKHQFKRIFPPKMSQEVSVEESIDTLSPENQLMFRWFKAKCVEDISWC